MKKILFVIIAVSFTTLSAFANGMCSLVPGISRLEVKSSGSNVTVFMKNTPNPQLKQNRAVDSKLQCYEAAVSKVKLPVPNYYAWIFSPTSSLNLSGGKQTIVGDNTEMKSIEMTKNSKMEEEAGIGVVDISSYNKDFYEGDHRSVEICNISMRDANGYLEREKAKGFWGKIYFKRVFRPTIISQGGLEACRKYAASTLISENIRRNDGSLPDLSQMSSTPEDKGRILLQKDSSGNVFIETADNIKIPYDQTHILLGQAQYYVTETGVTVSLKNEDTVNKIDYKDAIGMAGHKNPAN